LKKILLLTARLSEGGSVAIRPLEAALRRLALSGAQIETIDLFDSCHGRLEKLLGPAFHITGWARSLEDMLHHHGPDMVVVAAPEYGPLLAEMTRGGRRRDFALVGFLAEPEIDAPLWARMPADFFAVTQEEAARALSRAGVPENKLSVFGFPVEIPRGEDNPQLLPDLTRGGRARILYLVNAARKKSTRLLERLLRHPERDITACFDDEPEWEGAARALAATAPGRLRVLGHFREVPSLLRTHHLVISRAETGLVQEAVAARCPLLALKVDSPREEANLRLLQRANAGARATKPREVVEWLERALRDDGRLLALWRRNLEPLGNTGEPDALARFILAAGTETLAPPITVLPALPAPEAEGAVKLISLPSASPRLLRRAKKLLLCDLHTHTTWSDGRLSVAELVDFYGQRGFDCLCITDHLCDPQRLLGRLVNLTGLVIPPGDVPAYFEAIAQEKKRAWAQYELLLMTGLEFNKDGYTAKSSTHLLGVDLRQAIDPSLGLKDLITEIHAQGALAIASHPHEVKSAWGKNTLHLWEHIDEYAPLLDAWEVANRDDIFNPVGLRKLPFIASSDFHKPKHIHSWKTLLYCEKDPEAIKHCIRVNRDVSLTLYRDRRFGLEEGPVIPSSKENLGVGPETPPRLMAGRDV
jgi:processive 1,2-diacylglycerol beta-glucosyltransferase